MYKFLSEQTKEKIIDFLISINASFAFIEDYRSADVQKNRTKFTMLLIKGIFNLRDFIDIKILAESNELKISSSTDDQIEICFI